MSEEDPIARSERGRPSAYRSEFVSQAEKLCALGATDQELADFFGVEVRTLYRWKVEHDDFCQAIKTAKEVADNRVRRSLYQMAIGYEQEAVKIFMPAGAEAPVYAPYREIVPPNATAAIFWAKNRMKEEFRDKVEHEHSGEVGITVQVVKFSDDDSSAG